MEIRFPLTNCLWLRVIEGEVLKFWSCDKGLLTQQRQGEFDSSLLSKDCKIHIHIKCATELFNIITSYSYCMLADEHK